MFVQAKILLVDDDTAILSMLSEVLTEDGIAVESAATAEECREKISGGSYDLIVLDVMLGGTDGFELCREIRGLVKCPVIFLSAKNTPDDVVRGLTLGADDFISKPFDIEELVARINAHLRRESRAQPGAGRNALELGGIALNSSERTVTRDGRPVTLSTREFDLLEYLMQNAGHTVSREQIFRDVWKTSYGDIGIVAINIRNLRSKLDPDWAYIKTMWGSGYRFVVPSQTLAAEEKEGAE